MDVSLNGGPFRRIVRERDACQLPYDSFSHNSWIRPDGEVIGYPGPNFYAEPGRVRDSRPLIYAQPRIQPTELERWLQANSPRIAVFYAIFAVIAAAIGLRRVSRMV